MSPLKVFLAVVTISFALVGCGGDDPQPAEPGPEASVTESAAAPTPTPASKPFAAEQQLIKDAGELQSMLEKNAEEKKKAVTAAGG